MAVGISIFMMVMSIVYAFYVGAAKSTRGSVEYSDAIRSVMIASEAIRRDVSQMLFQRVGRDLAIFDDYRALSVRVPSSTLAEVDDGSDLWRAEHTPVTYTLEPVQNSKSNAKILIRKETENNREDRLRSCLLQDMFVQYFPPSSAAESISPLQGYLDIAVIGLASKDSSVKYTTSLLIPLPYMSAPQPYQVDVDVPIKNN